MENLNLQNLDNYYTLGLCGVFVGIYLLVYALNYFLVEPVLRRRQLRQRLKVSKRDQEVSAKIFKAQQDFQGSLVLELVSKVAGWSKVENLERHLLRADIYMSPGAFLSMVGLLGCAGFISGMLYGSILFGMGAGSLLGFAPLVVVRFKQRRKAKKFEKQMPEAMELLARSLRAGHTMSATLELVSQEIAPPLGREMRITYEEQRLGLSMMQAMRRMGERVASRDLLYFITAVLIQTETGGNLAEILENIGHIIRERMKLKSKIQGLTAEGRFSALILIFLPVATFFMLFLLNREYVMVLLRDPLGFKLLLAGIISIMIGALCMKKMVNIKV
jgi:tight adherence protein B